MTTQTLQISIIDFGKITVTHRSKRDKTRLPVIPVLMMTTNTRSFRMSQEEQTVLNAMRIDNDIYEKISEDAQIACRTISQQVRFVLKEYADSPDEQE